MHFLKHDARYVREYKQVRPRHRAARDIKKIKEKAKGTSSHGIFLGERKHFETSRYGASEKHLNPFDFFHLTVLMFHFFLPNSSVFFLHLRDAHPV